MTVPAKMKVAWKSAQLFIAFHKNKQKKRRDEPVLWRPNDATARLPDDPEDKEAFVVVKGDGDGQDVQIKMHPDKLVLRRDESEAIGWTGIIADHYQVRVKVGETWIVVGADGSVQRQTEGMEGTAMIEADGGFLRVGCEAEIMVSGDGSQLTRRTQYQLDAITADGVVSRRK